MPREGLAPKRLNAGASDAAVARVELETVAS